MKSNITHAVTFEDNLNNTECTEFSTCTKCVNVKQCIWSTEKQTCSNNKEVSENLGDDRKIMCPQFSINNIAYEKLGKLIYNLRVKISNDKNNFFKFLQKRDNIICHLGVLNQTWTMKANLVNDEIICSSIYKIHIFNYKCFLYYFFIEFDNILLQFDNFKDHYIIFGTEDSKNNYVNGCIDCSWDTHKFRYLSSWCPSNNYCQKSYQNYDIRNTKEKFSLVDENIEVQNECTVTEIKSIEPLYALKTDKTTVNITVKNHWILIEKKTMIITVAGQNCLDPQILDREIIICTIYPKTTNEPKNGPVEIIYVSSKNFTLKSSEIFNFVDPEVTSIRPTYGSLLGGTLLYINGTFLDLFNDVQVFINEDIGCNVTKYERHYITCITGPSTTFMTAKVKVKFNSYLSKYVNNTLFEYYDNPIIDKGQTFTGIVSGGTKFPVRGQYFTRVVNMMFYVEYNGIKLHNDCQVKNESYMICPTPRLNISSLEVSLELKCGFQWNFVTSKLLKESRTTNYTVYSDPVYTDFTINDQVVFVRTQNWNKGYLLDDLLIKVKNSTNVCSFVLMVQYWIVCEISPSILIDDAIVDEIIIIVGDNLVYNVKKSKKSLYIEENTNNIIIWTISLLFLLILTNLLVMIFCIKNKKVYNVTALNKSSKLNLLPENKNINESVVLKEIE